ncbi:hypothetical protein GGI20_004081, partial [Coemansia sp. BCRC 34301]
INITTGPMTDIIGNMAAIYLTYLKRHTADSIRLLTRRLVVASLLKDNPPVPEDMLDEVRKLGNGSDQEVRKQKCKIRQRIAVWKRSNWPVLHKQVNARADAVVDCLYKPIDSAPDSDLAADWDKYGYNASKCPTLKKQIMYYVQIDTTVLYDLVVAREQHMCDGVCLNGYESCDPILKNLFKDPNEREIQWKELFARPPGKHFQEDRAEHWLQYFNIPASLIRKQVSDAVHPGKRYFMSSITTNGVGASIRTFEWSRISASASQNKLSFWLAQHDTSFVSTPNRWEDSRNDIAGTTTPAVADPGADVAAEAPAAVARHSAFVGEPFGARTPTLDKDKESILADYRMACFSSSGALPDYAARQGTPTDTYGRLDVAVDKARRKAFAAVSEFKSIGVDPGKHDLFYAAQYGDAKWTRSVSARQYYQDSGFKWHKAEVLKLLAKDPGLSEWISTIPSFKTTSSAVTLESLTSLFKSDEFDSYMDVHLSLHARILCWQTAKHKQSTLDTMCDRLTAGFGKLKTVICFGGANIQSTMRGWMSTPKSQRIVACLRRHGWCVLIVDEYNTSKDRATRAGCIASAKRLADLDKTFDAALEGAGMGTASQLVPDPGRIRTKVFMLSPAKAAARIEARAEARRNIQAHQARANRKHIHELRRLSKGKDKDHAEAAKKALWIDGERSTLIVIQRAHEYEAAVAKQAILDRRASYSHKHIYMVLPL